MPKRLYPTDVLSQAQTVSNGWAQVDANLAFGSVNWFGLSEKLTCANTLDAEIGKLEALLIDKRNQRDQLYGEIWDSVKRVRAGMKANFGDDSSQYEMIGGVRLSERKNPTRKVTA